MRPDTRHPVTPQLVVGFALTILGVLLTLDRLGIVAMSTLRPLWPTVLTAFGVALLVRRRDGSGRFWGLTWTVLGAWWLFNSLGVLQVRLWELIGPALLILVGWTILRRTLRPDPTSLPPPPPEPDPFGLQFSLPPETSPPVSTTLVDVPPLPPPQSPPPAASRGAPQVQTHHLGRVSLLAFMGEVKRASGDHPFRGGEMTAVMGGCMLDLRQATIPPGGMVRLNLIGLMAGHEVRVPRDWAVHSDVVPIMGSVEDKRITPLATAADAPRLLLDGFMVMGGVVIRN